MKYTNPLYQPRPEVSTVHRDMAKQVEQLTELARATIKPPVDYVYYNDFRVNMLPLLAAIANGQDFDIDRWGSLVSHHNVEVSVIDEDTQEERYRISSIYHNSEIATDNVTEPGLSVAALEAQKQRFVSIPMAQQSIIDALIENTVPVTGEEMFESGVLAIERLNKIFKDHKLPLLPDPRDFLKKPKAEGETVTESAPAPSVEDDEFDQL